MLPTYHIHLHPYKILNIFRLPSIFNCVYVYVLGVKRLSKLSVKLEEKGN